jgi:hypothetical protein
MAKRKEWWEILRDQFASRGLLDPESERVQEAVQAAPAVQRQARGLLSLDPQAESDTVLEMGLGSLPGVGQAMALRDLERARRAKDPGAAAMAASNFIPFGTLLNRFRRGPMSELDVYHGTPHRFPATEANPLGEFDASKIGTGEGAQAYGHGVYLAEDPKIAAEYSKRLWANKNYLGHPEINAAEKKASNASNAWFQSVIDGAPTETKAKLKAVYEAADAELKTTKSQYGRQMYKADLPDKMIDKMLDWDEPIGAGRENLLAEIAKNPKLDVKQYEELLGLTPKSVNQQETGEMLYKALREDLGSDKEASAVFQQAGFPGVKYLDALAKKRRSDLDWTDKKDKRNFVVFPGEEKKVKILERK